jgi:hypothetical protein
LHFLNPAVLVGLVAAALPLVIHLLNRSRTPPIPFSNLEFLRRLHHSRMRRVRVRQWLVLLLRTLIILLIVSAFARPAYREGGAGLLGHTRPTAAVILVDRSFSTTYRLSEGRIFDLLHAGARELAGFFGERDRLFLAPFALVTDAEEAATDAAAFSASLEQLTASEEATDVGGALSRASEILAPLEQFSREVYLFTDLTTSAWEDLGDHQEWLPEAKVFVVSPAPGSRANTYLDRLEVNNWMAVPGTKLEARFEVANSSTAPVETAAVDLFVDDRRVGRHTAPLPAGRSIPVSIAFAPARAGDLTGYLELEDDRLNLDNRRYLSFGVADSIHVLILGASPNDTYYPRRGLAAAASEDRALLVETGLFSDLNAELLDPVQVLLLCNLEHLGRETVALLHRFVAAGGGLVIFPSPQADMSFFNRRLLPGLIPVALTGVTGDPTDPTGYQLLADAGSHALLHQLLPDLAADRPRFGASFELVPRGPLNPLVYFEEGQLAMVSAWKERGRTVLMAFPLSLNWNDLPVRGMFAPLLHRLVRLLGVRGGESSTYLVGQTVHRLLPGVAIESSVMAKSPNGKRFLLEPQQSGGRLLWRIPTVEKAGIWTIEANGEQVDQFPVNVDTGESRLEVIDREVVGRLLGASRVHFLNVGQELEPAVMALRHGRELWREFLGLAVLLLLVELWVARAPHSAPKRDTAETQESRSESRSRSVS